MFLLYVRASVRTVPESRTNKKDFRRQNCCEHPLTTNSRSILTHDLPIVQRKLRYRIFFYSGVHLYLTENQKLFILSVISFKI